MARREGEEKMNRVTLTALRMMIFVMLVITLFVLTGCPPSGVNPYVDWPTIKIDWPDGSGVAHLHLTIPFGESFVDELGPDSIYVYADGSEQITTRQMTNDSEIQWIGASCDKFGWDIYSVQPWEPFNYNNRSVAVKTIVDRRDGNWRGNIFVARTDTQTGITEICYLNLYLWEGRFGPNANIITDDGNGELIIAFSLTGNNGGEGEGEGEIEIAPIILDQPDTTSAPIGQEVQFTVIAGGNNLNYQWQDNGIDITPTSYSGGVNSATLTIYSVNKVNEGAYSCRVWNNAGEVDSNPALLTVIDNTPQGVAPTITGDPISDTVARGDSFTLAVTATGTDPLTYQWTKDGNNISGATDSSYTINSVVVTDAGDYACKVINPYGSAWSDTAILTIPAENTEIVKIGQVDYNGEIPTAYGFMRFYDNYPSGPYFVKEVASASGSNPVTITGESSRVNNNGDVVWRSIPIAIAAPDANHPDGVYYIDDPTKYSLGYNSGDMGLYNNAYQVKLY